MGTEQQTPGQNRLAVETHSIDFVPLDARHGAPRDLFPMWFGANMNITIVLSGSVAIIPGLSLLWTGVALLVGILIGGVFMAYHSLQGPHLGLPQMIQSRAQFGFRGANIPLVIVLIMYLGFFAAGSAISGDALRDLLGISTSSGILLTSVAIVVLVFVGYRAIHAYQKILTVLGFIVFTLLTIAILTSAGQPKAGSMPAVGTSAGFVAGPFLIVVALGAVLLLSYAPYVADYSRYLPADTKAKPTFWYSYGGAVVSIAWMMLLGAVLQNRFPDSTVAEQVHIVASAWGPGFSSLVTLTIVLGIVGINALNTYGAYMSAMTITTSFVKTWQPTLTFRVLFIAPIIVIATGLAFLQQSNLLDAWQNFLGFLLYFLIPWSAVNLADYYLVRNAKYETKDFFVPGGWYGNFNSAGMIAFFAACIAQIPFVNTAFFQGPVSHALGGGDISWLVGFLVAGAAYIPLARKRIQDHEVSISR